MIRMLSVIALFVLAFPGRSAQQPEPTETLIPLKVQAARAPKPALRYQLLPELREVQPGNAILGYLKCFMEQNHFFHSKEAEAERERLEAMPLKELAKQKLLGYGGVALRRADEAARLDNPDWQTLLPLRRDGVGLLVPEVQQLRMLARDLAIRFRIEVAGGRFDDALTTAKTLFALSRHLGEHPILIGDLVAVAIANYTIGPLEEMLQQPGCPNLYWALTDLPHPFIDLRRGMQGERMILTKEFSALDEQVPMTDQQLKKITDQFQSGFFDLGPKGPKETSWKELWARAKDATYLQAAQRRLTEYGLSEENLKQFPPLQIVLLDGKLTYETWRDEIAKGFSLPYWQAAPLLNAGRARMLKEESPFAKLIPNLAGVRMSQARLEQRFALLRCVEALRLHAADHDGKLPAKLSDVQVPLPDDPVTGRPFQYQVDGDTASLRSTPPPGMEKHPVFRVHYRVTMVK